MEYQVAVFSIDIKANFCMIWQNEMIVQGEVFDLSEDENLGIQNVDPNDVIGTVNSAALRL